MKNVFDFGEMLDVNGGAEMPVRRRIKLSCNKCGVKRYHNKQVLYVPRGVRTSVINLYRARHEWLPAAPDYSVRNPTFTRDLVLDDRSGDASP